MTTTLISPLRSAMHVGAGRPSMTCGDDHLTYADTWNRCRRLAGALHGLGLQRGDRVAVVAANCHRYLELYMGVPAAGLVVVPLNARHTESELRYALEDSGTKVLFTDLDAAALRDTVEHVFDMKDEYDALLAGAEPTDFPDDVAETDLAGLFYTGGTVRAPEPIASHRPVPRAHRRRVLRLSVVDELIPSTH